MHAILLHIVSIPGVIFRIYGMPNKYVHVDTALNIFMHPPIIYTAYLSGSQGSWSQFQLTVGTPWFDHQSAIHTQTYTFKLNLNLNLWAL